MDNETEKTGLKGIWDVLKFLGVIIIILSLGGGLIILVEYGTVQTTYTTSEYNLIGIISGIAVIFQGSITGVLLIAFSALGESVNNIENKFIA